MTLTEYTNWRQPEPVSIHPAGGDENGRRFVSVRPLRRISRTAALVDCLFLSAISSNFAGLTYAYIAAPDGVVVELTQYDSAIQQPLKLTAEQRRPIEGNVPTCETCN